MIVYCAWCDASMGEKAPLEDRGLTSGLCMRCYVRVRRQSGLPQPAVVGKHAGRGAREGIELRKPAPRVACPTR